MSNTLVNFLVCTIFISGIAVCVRTVMVVRLRIRIMEMCMDFDRRNMQVIAFDRKKDAFLWMFMKLPSPKKMFFSFKRLKVRNWVSEEDLEKLKS